ARVESMMPGILAEAAALRANGYGRVLTASQSIGYAEAVACLEGRLGLDEAAARTVRRTKALARRQLAWLRRDPSMAWFTASDDCTLNECNAHGELAGMWEKRNRRSAKRVYDRGHTSWTRIDIATCNTMRHLALRV